MTKINKRPLIGSLIFSTFAAVLLDYLYMGLLIALPKFSSGSMAPVIADMKQPIQLTQEAIKNPGFTQFQFVILIAFGFFVYSFYKKLNGPSKYDDASKYGSHGTAREATEREVFDEKNVVKKLKKTYLLEDVKKSFELQERVNKEIEEREESGYEPDPEIVSRISKQVLEMKRIEQKRVQQVINEAADLEEKKQKEFIETEVAKIPKRYLNVSKNGAPARLSLRETDNDTLIQHIPSSQEYIREYQKKLFKPVTDRSGIILGLMNDSPVVMHKKSGWGNRNVLVVGGSGSRKTQSVGFPNVIFQTESSILVSDPKGEIFEGTAKIKEKQGYTVKVINFTNMRISNRWNPFDYIREEAEVSIVANAIVASKNNPEKKDFWYNAQYMLLRALILYVLHEVEPQKRNIEGVLDFLQEFDDEGMEDGESALDEVFMALDFKHPARVAYQLGYKKSKENTRDNIIVSLLSTLADFTSETVARFTRTSDFLLGDLGRQRIALYLIIDPLDGTWTSLINLFVSQLFRELYKVGDENNAKLYVPVSMIFDEFANLGKLPRFIEFLSTCRGYGISVMPIVQGIPQLQKLYGKEDTESIMANCTAKIVLKASDYETQKYFSNLAGKTTVKVIAGSTSTSAKSATKNDAFSHTQRDLMTPDEVKNLSNEESLIFTDSTYVIRAHKSFQYELFKDKKRLLIDQYKMNREDFKLEQTFETKAIMQEKTQEFKEKYRENALAAVEAATAAASAIGLDEDLNAIEKELLEDEHQISVEPEQSEGKFKKLYIGVSNENLLNQEDISPSLKNEDSGPSYETAGNMEQEVLHEISTNESPAVLDETEEFLEGLTELQLSLNELEGTEVNSYPSSKIEDPAEIEDLVFELENDLNNLGTELGDLDDLYLAMDGGMENENKGGLDKKLTILR